MADIFAKDEEHENVFRHLRVVIDETKEVFVQLLNFYLSTIPETYEQFIERNVHEIYHYCYADKCCQCQCNSCYNPCPKCVCPPPYKRRIIGKRIIHPPQLEVFLDKAGPKVVGHDSGYRSAPYCCYPVNPALNISDLDVTLARFLLVNFTTIVQNGTAERKALDDLVEMRNKFAHAATSRMSNKEYQTSLNKSKQLLVLAKLYGKEQETKDKLDAIGKEPFNPKVCIDLLNTLLLQAKADNDLHETVRELTEIVKELMTLKTEQTIPDFIIKDIHNITVLEGDDVCFEIWLKEKTFPVKWYKNDSEIVTDSEKMSMTTKGNIHKLCISSCCEDDKGLYSAQVKDTYRKAILDVTDFYTKNLKDVHCIEGDNVIFDCEVLYTDIKAQWYKDGKKDDNTEKRYTVMEQKRHTMAIPCVEMNDRGSYQIDIQGRKRCATLQVESYFTINLKDITSIEGESATFVCEVIEDNTNAEWFLNDKEIKSSKRIEQQTSGRQHKLSFTNTLVSDSGEYTVIVKNCKRKAILKVKEYYTKTLEQVFCVEGDDVSFDCEVIYPSLKASWYKNGTTIESTSKQCITMVLNLHNLRIPFVDLNDSGRYEIDIQGRRRSADLKIKSYFTQQTDEITCTEGESVTFVFEVIEEDTSADWFLKDKEVKPSPRTKRVTSGRQHRLTINDTQVGDSGEYSIVVNNKKRTTKLNVEDNKVIRHAYLNDIKTKTEKRFYIRVMIVGEHGVGKTCLLRRLLGEEIKGVESTDGIDIVVRRCKIRLLDGKWIFIGDQDPKREYAIRIKRARQEGNVEQDINVPSTINRMTTTGLIDQINLEVKSNIHQKELNNTTAAKETTTSHQPDKYVSERKTQNTQKGQDEGFSIQNNRTLSKLTERVTSPRKIPKVLTDVVGKELEHFLSRIEKYENENDVHIEVGFWDFAGEKDYYGTHHTFLDSNALYLLVTDCSEDIKQTEPCMTYDSIGGYVDFWFDTIHNCADMEDKTSGQQLDPPIIAVCTGVDKLTEKVQRKKEQYCQRFRDAVQDGPKRKHFRNICFVSNSQPTDVDFDHVRHLIFENGKRLKSFGESLPLKWIRLEQSLDVLRESGISIISRFDVIDLSAKCDFNDEERDKEVEHFLKHQHKIGSIIYYSDIKDYVILSQQWLANAFRCLVSDKIDSTIKFSADWEKLEKTGILEMSLISRLFQKNPELEFDKYQDHIINILNKFDIIGINSEKGNTFYYMPYMITSTYSPSVSIISKTFGAVNESCKPTPWLCLEFDFFPVAFFTHVMLYFVRNYTICFDSQLNKRSIYHGVGVFFLDETKINKFIVLFCKNTIAIQVWLWDPVSGNRYINILREIEKIIDDLKMKYKATNLSYAVKLKCAGGDINSPSGRISHCDLLDKSKYGEYFCDDHNKKHDSAQLFNTWFYRKSVIEEQINKDTSINAISCTDKTTCKLCVSNPKPGMYWCKECAQAMCHECASEHCSEPKSSTHTMTRMCIFNISIMDIDISDIASVSGGELIMSDRRGKRLVTCEIKDKNIKYVHLTHQPLGIAVINQNSVAVITHNEDTRKVLIVDIRKRIVMKHIDLKKWCCGIMFRNNVLYVGCKDDSLVELYITGEIIRTISLGFTPWCICSGKEGRIYCTVYKSDSVYCIDTEGKVIFTVNKPGMSLPTGITTDNDGYVFVVCNRSNKIHKISPEGTEYDVILINDMPSTTYRPYICFDSISKFLVVGVRNTVYVCRN